MKICLPLLASLLASSSVTAQVPNVPLKLVSTISIPQIEGRIDHFSIDLQHHTVFIAALGANTVVAIDLVHVIPELKELLVAIPSKGSQDASLQIYHVQ